MRGIAFFAILLNAVVVEGNGTYQVHSCQQSPNYAWRQPNDKAYVACCSMDGTKANRWGGTNGFPDNECSGLMTLEEARARCAAGGSRLCNSVEIPRSCGTGCNYDKEYVWANTANTEPPSSTAATSKSPSKYPTPEPSQSPSAESTHKSPNPSIQSTQSPSSISTAAPSKGSLCTLDDYCLLKIGHTIQWLQIYQKNNTCEDNWAISVYDNSLMGMHKNCKWNATKTTYKDPAVQVCYDKIKEKTPSVCELCTLDDYCLLKIGHTIQWLQIYQKNNTCEDNWAISVYDNSLMGMHKNCKWNATKTTYKDPAVQLCYGKIKEKTPSVCKYPMEPAQRTSPAPTTKPPSSTTATSKSPSKYPTPEPSQSPSIPPTHTSPNPSIPPTQNSPNPSIEPTQQSAKPSIEPTKQSPKPSIQPTNQSPKPSLQPSQEPTQKNEGEGDTTAPTKSNLSPTAAGFSPFDADVSGAASASAFTVASSVVSALFFVVVLFR